MGRTRLPEGRRACQPGPYARRDKRFYLLAVDGDRLHVWQDKRARPAQAEYAAGGLSKQGMTVILLARAHATGRTAGRRTHHQTARPQPVRTGNGQRPGKKARGVF